MRYGDDLVVYAMPRRRMVYDYGYAVDDAELARVEDAARYISSQTIEDADRIRDISRRSDQMVIDKANRIIDRSREPSVPTSHLRAHRYPVGLDMVLRDQARGLNKRLNRSMSVSDLSEPAGSYVIVPRTHWIPPTNNHGRIPISRHIPPSSRYVPRRQHAANYRHIYSTADYGPAPVSDYRRRLERKLDTDLLTYELPRPEAYNGIREHLRGVNDKLLAHRLLLDRYAGIEMTHPTSVEQQVESKYSELMARMPGVGRASRESSVSRRY